MQSLSINSITAVSPVSISKAIRRIVNRAFCWVNTNYRTFTPEQKKELLQGLLTTIDVHLIDKQTHWLEINFKIPLVGDQLVYKDPTQKSKGYTVKEGETALMIEMASRPYSPKKTSPTRA